MPTIKQTMSTPILGDPNNNHAIVDEANDGLKAVPVELVTKAADDSTFSQVGDNNPLAAKIVTALPAGANKIGSVDAQITGSSLSSVVTMQNAATAAGAGTALSTNGQGVALLAVSGTFVATITFEGQGPDGNWYVINALQRGTGSIATTATAPGLFEINTRGLSAVRANITSYTSGSVTVKGQAQPLSTGGEFVSLSGSKVVEETILNAVSVAAQTYVEFNISPTSEDEIWFLISIDKQPWSVMTSTQTYGGSDGGSDMLFPKRDNVTNTFGIAAPCASLFLGGINLASQWGLTGPTSMLEAKQYMVPYKSNAKARIYNKHATDTATITIKLLRVWKSGGRK